MIIAVTGTPGVGKTTLAKNLAKELKYDLIDVNAFIADHENVVLEFDEDRDTKIIDEEKLCDLIEQHIVNNNMTDIVIDSHMSHYISSKIIDTCIVLTCDLGNLKKRLIARGYNDLKIKENLEAETFDTILCEAQDYGHNVVSFDNTEFVEVQEVIDKLEFLY